MADKTTSQQIGALYISTTLDTGSMSGAISKARKDLQDLKTTTEQAGAAADKTSAAMNKTAAAHTKAAAAAKGNAGQTANLVSQFNDIAVMMAAGQNPLQLAMQQGTQISQVLTQMGGGVGALRALGSAFIGMLNPISLATIGVIGFGSWAIQALMPAKEEAKKTKDSFEELKDSLSNYNSALSVSLTYTGEAESKYGEEAKRGADIARRIMVHEAEKTRASVSNILTKSYSELGFESFGENDIAGKRKFDSSSLSEVASNLGFDDGGMFSVGGVKREDLALVAEYGNEMRKLYQFLAQKPDSSQMDQWFTDLRNQIDSLTQSHQNLLNAGADVSAIEASQAKLDQLTNQFLLAEKERADIKAAEQSKANDMLATMEQQAAMNELINQYGGDSLQVREAELQAEFEKRNAAIDALQVSDEIKASLWDQSAALHDAESATLAWADATEAVNASLRAAASIIASIGGGAVNRAARAAGRAVMDAGGTALQVRRAEERSRAISAAQADLQAGRMRPDEYARTLADIDTGMAEVDSYRSDYDALVSSEREAGRASRGGGSRRGGSGGRGGRSKMSEAEREAEREARKQKEAYEALDERLVTLQATFGKTALEQKIYTEQQKIGTAATAEDVAEKVKLIDTIEKIHDAMAEAKNIFTDAFADIITGARSAREVLADILNDMANRLARIAGNSLFDSLFGGVFKGLAGGLGGSVVGNDALSDAFRAIPGFATGTNGASGGWAVVGEAGPELVSLNRGARVLDHQKTANMLGGGKSTNGRLAISLQDGLKAEWLGEAGSQAASIAQAGIKSYDQNQAPKRIQAFQRNPRKSG